MRKICNNSNRAAGNFFFTSVIFPFVLSFRVLNYGAKGKIKSRSEKVSCSPFNLLSFLFYGFIISLTIVNIGYAKDITVDGGGGADFKKIQDAVNSAQSGDDIKVKAGVYNENIILKSGVSLKGEGYENTRIEYTGEGAVIYGKGVESLRVEGFTISYKGSDKRSLLFLVSSKITVSNCAVFGSNLSGIEAREGSDLIVGKNIIKGNMGSGVFIYKGSKGRIEGNQIIGNKFYGIDIKDNSETIISSNEIKENKAGGILVREVSKGDIKNNVIANNSVNGIGIKNAQVAIINNSIVGNEKAGMWIYNFQQGSIKNNIIFSNEIGINVEKAQDITVSYNNVWGNKNDYTGVSKPQFDISINPMFADYAGGDYRLKPNSACIKAGENGEDMGAFPFIEPPKTVEAVQPVKAEQAAAPQPPPTPIVDCEQAKEWYNKGVNLSDFSETEASHYKKAISLCPDFYNAHYNLGLIYKKAKKFEDAIKEFKEAIRVKSDFSEAHFSLALIYDESNKFEEAILEYQEAIKHKQDFANAHYNLGGIYWMQKKWSLVIKEMEETLKIKPDHKLAKELMEKAKKKVETP